MIIFKYYGELREATGKSKESVEVSSLRDAFEYIRQRYGGGAFERVNRCEIFLNGERLLNRQNRSLNPGDELSFISHVAGGSGGTFPRIPG